LISGIGFDIDRLKDTENLNRRKKDSRTGLEDRKHKPSFCFEKQGPRSRIHTPPN
jgi:hypothetical protein